MNIKKIILLIFVVSIFVLPINVLAIGLITNPVDVENALRGETFQDVLKLFNSETNETYYELMAEGDIAEWVTFYEVGDLDNSVTKVLAPPQKYYDVIFIIEVPEDTANGDYVGKLTVISVPGENEEGKSTTTVRQRVSREVFITVTDQEDIKLDVSVIPNTYDVRKNKVLKIRLVYDNQGNVSLKPQIDFKITDVDGKMVYNAIYPYPEGESSVKPGSQHESSALEIPTNSLSIGSYRAHLNFLHNNDIVLEKDFGFSVRNRGLVLGVKIFNVDIFWPIVILVLMIVVAFAIIKVSKNKKNNMVL